MSHSYAGAWRNAFRQPVVVGKRRNRQTIGRQLRECLGAGTPHGRHTGAHLRVHHTGDCFPAGNHCSASMSPTPGNSILSRKPRRGSTSWPSIGSDNDLRISSASANNAAGPAGSSTCPSDHVDSGTLRPAPDPQRLQAGLRNRKGPNLASAW
jgi:hypothetical protein